MSRQIQLTQGFYATVDDDDYEWLNQWSWKIFKSGNNMYAGRSEKRMLGITRKSILMHRVILGEPLDEIDHINGNGLDNRRDNLRACSHSQNLMNRNKTLENTSGFKGVKKYHHRFIARITINGKEKHIGTYSTAEEAAHAYDIEAVKQYGEFARTNF